VAIQDLLNNLFVETVQDKQLVAAVPSHVAHEASHPQVPLASKTLPVYKIKLILKFRIKNQINY
jgi:hypothetical protein